MKGKIKMNKNKILTAVMAGTMMMGSVLPVFAATSTPSITTDTVSKEEADASSTEVTEVTYAQSSTFTVTIPKKIVLGDTKISDYNVNVKGDISSDKQVKVAPDASFAMKDQGAVEALRKGDVTATVTQDVKVWSSEEVCKEEGTDKAGNVSATDLTSGTWAGTFEFSIALEDAE